MSAEQLLNDPDLTAAPRRSFGRRLVRDPQAVITAALLLLIIAAGFLGPLVFTVDPNQADLRSANALPGTPGHPLGADQTGRDILARLFASTQTSAISGLIGAGVALVVGVTMGLIGGYFGRRSSAVTEWVFNLIMTFPGVLLLIVLTPLTGGDYRFTMFIFGFMLSPTIFRITRNLVLGTKQELFVDAARVAGLSNTRILGRHVLSAVRGPIIVATAFLIGTAIATQAGLAFLGIGSTAVPSFGSMVAEGFTNLSRRPLQFLWPSLVLGVITASLVLLGNYLRDALEGLRTAPPRRRRTETPRERTAMQEDGEAPLLRIRDLAIGYPSPTGEVREVVHGVDLDIQAGEILGLVGESGSGKSQTAFAVLGLLPPEAVVIRGSARLNGTEMLGLGREEMRRYRGRTIAYIPQEPMSNLDPSYRVGSQLVESLCATSDLSKREAKEHVITLLTRVGIPEPQRVFRMYPFEISGGMAQRVLIAGAVASRPALLIADEPTTALDVTVQAEILDLLRDLQAEIGMAVLLVTHNFGVVADLCESIAVMEKGRIVEAGEVRQTFAAPQAEYTRSLLGSILDEDTVRTDPPVARRDQKEVAR